MNKKGESEGYDSCKPPNNLVQIGPKPWFFTLVTFKLDRWPRKTIGHFFHFPTNFVSFHSHPWIQIGIFVWKHWLRSQILDSAARVNSNFDRWPKNHRKTHLCLSKFVLQLIAMCEWIQSSFSVSKCTIRPKLAFCNYSWKMSWWYLVAAENTTIFIQGKTAIMSCVKWTWSSRSLNVLISYPSLTTLKSRTSCLRC